MVAGICNNDFQNYFGAGIRNNNFKILLAESFKFENKIPLFRYSDDTVIAMTSFLKSEIEISFLRLSHHLTLPTPCM